jgi:hypothetical protein
MIGIGGLAEMERVYASDIMRNAQYCGIGYV